MDGPVPNGFNPQTNGGRSSAVVLIGFAEALAAPEVVWSLVDEGFRVIAFSRKGRVSALRYSRHVTCYDICAPESDPQSAMSDLRSLLGSLSVQHGDARRVLLPVDDKSLWLCNRMPPDERWLLAAARGSCADLALDKSLQVEAARKAGFNVPNTLVVRTRKELDEFSAAEPFPLFLKAAESVPTYGGRVYSSRKWVCQNRQELDRAIAEWGERIPLLVQQVIAGRGEGIFGLATLEGIRAWSAHRRLRMMNPHGSGSSACISQPVSGDVRPQAEALISSVGWQGLFMIELLRDHSGKPWFVELNGRAWGSMALSRRQGLEYPAWHVRLALDPQSGIGAETASAPGVVCRNVGRELMHVLFVLRGARSKAQAEWPPFWKTLRNVIRIRRNDTFYNWRRDDPRVLFADCCCTIHDNLFKAKH